MSVDFLAVVTAELISSHVVAITKKSAILNANYIAARLEKLFTVLYRSHGLVAHECILDLRAFHSVTAEDVAKRLMDYGSFRHLTPALSPFEAEREKFSRGPSPARSWSNRPKANRNTNSTVSVTR